MEINTYSILKIVLETVHNTINISHSGNSNIEYVAALKELRAALEKVMKFF